MLTITVEANEIWNAKKNEFIIIPEQKISLEHSLVSLSKWESIHHKPFLGKDEKTKEEILDYIKCMTISQNVDDNIYNFLSEKNCKEINEYIEDSRTATTFYDRNKNSGPKGREVITSELIYYWMINYNIPFECQKWHLNRLLTLIKVCNIKSDSGKKMSKNEILSSNKALNEARRRQYNTRG